MAYEVKYITNLEALEGEGSSATLSSHGWQIHMAVAPGQLQKNNPHNKIEKIKEILENTLADYPVNVRCTILQEENDPEWDGTLSKAGTDHDARGKGIFISVANSGTEHTLTTEDYKNMLLLLWHNFQEADIALFCLPSTYGRNVVLGPDRFFTPFVVTSKHPNSWGVKHGVLLKRFAGYDTVHPLLQVKFSVQDLLGSGIFYDSQAEVSNYSQYVPWHQELAYQELNKYILHNVAVKEPFKEFLFNEDNWQHIKEKVNNYKRNCEQLEKIEDEAARADAELALEEECKAYEEDPVVQRLIEGYPCTPSSQLVPHLKISNLSDLAVLANKKDPDQAIDAIRVELQDNYVAGFNKSPLQSIEEDFEKQIFTPEAVAEFDSHRKAKKNSEETVSSAGDSVRRVSLLSFIHSHLKELVAQSPRAMQVVFRRLVLMQKEAKIFQEFSEASPAKNLIKIDPATMPKVAGKWPLEINMHICTYLQNRTPSFFSWAFRDTERGAIRARIYQNAFASADFDAKQKVLIAYSVLASTRGNTLKQYVARAFDANGDVDNALTAVRAQVRNEFGIKDDNPASQQRIEVERIIANIVTAVENPIQKDGKVQEILPKDVFAPVTPPEQYESYLPKDSLGVHGIACGGRSPLRKRKG